MSKPVKMEFGPYVATIDNNVGCWIVTLNGLLVGDFSVLLPNHQTMFKEYVSNAEYLFRRKNGFGNIPTKRVPIPVPPMYSKDEDLVFSVPTQEVFDCELKVTMEDTQS